MFVRYSSTHEREGVSRVRRRALDMWQKSKTPRSSLQNRLILLHVLYKGRSSHDLVQGTVRAHSIYMHNNKSRVKTNADRCRKYAQCELVTTDVATPLASFLCLGMRLRIHHMFQLHPFLLFQPTVGDVWSSLTLIINFGFCFLHARPHKCIATTVQRVTYS